MQLGDDLKPLSASGLRVGIPTNVHSRGSGSRGTGRRLVKARTRLELKRFMRAIRTKCLTTVAFRRLIGAKATVGKPTAPGGGDGRLESGHFDLSISASLLFQLTRAAEQTGRVQFRLLKSGNLQRPSASLRCTRCHPVLFEGGQAVTHRTQCVAAWISGLRQAYRDSFRPRCEQNSRHWSAQERLSTNKGSLLQGAQL